MMEGGYSASSEDSDSACKKKTAKAAKRKYKISASTESRGRSSSGDSILEDTLPIVDVEVQDEPAVFDHPNFHQFQKNMSASDEDASQMDSKDELIEDLHKKINSKDEEIRKLRQQNGLLKRLFSRSKRGGVEKLTPFQEHLGSKR